MVIKCLTIVRSRAYCTSQCVVTYVTIFKLRDFSSCQQISCKSSQVTHMTLLRSFVCGEVRSRILGLQAGLTSVESCKKGQGSVLSS